MLLTAAAEAAIDRTATLRDEPYVSCKMHCQQPIISGMTE